MALKTLELENQFSSLVQESSARLDTLSNQLEAAQVLLRQHLGIGLQVSVHPSPSIGADPF
jgi:hypothetical protein